MKNKNKKFYAIKIGNGMRDEIVMSWEECKKYVIGYEAIYKKFDDKESARIWLNSWTEYKIKDRLRKNEKHRFRRLKRKIEFEYEFPIPDYIIDEMINYDDYDELVSLLDIAVKDKDLSKSQAIKIKNREYKKRKNH